MPLVLLRRRYDRDQAYKAGEGIQTLNIQLGRLDDEQSKGLPEHADTNGAVPRVPRSVPCGHENAPEPHDAEHLAAIADLLADLPQTERREVIAELVPSDRVAIARLLIDRRNSGPKQ